MSNRISREKMFILMTHVVSKRSSCLRAQVGALLVKEGHIISMGYNGPVAGAPDCTPRVTPEEVMNNPFYKDRPVAKVLEELNLETTCEGPGCTRSLHAETNAIAFAAKTGVPVEGCTLYCTMSPCINCAKVIINSGIKEVLYLDEYRDDSGLKMLRNSGVSARRVSYE